MDYRLVMLSCTALSALIHANSARSIIEGATADGVDEDSVFEMSQPFVQEAEELMCSLPYGFQAEA